MAQNKQRPPGATPAPKPMALPADYAGQPQDYLNVVIGKSGKVLKPYYETVLKVIEELENLPECRGRFPTTTSVINEVFKDGTKDNGTMQVLLAHYHRIERERAGLVGRDKEGRTLEEMKKLIADAEEARNRARALANEKSKEVMELKEQVRQMLYASRKTNTVGWMLPGQAALGGDDGAIRALQARIAKLEAERDEAMRLADRLDEVLRPLRESPGE